MSEQNKLLLEELKDSKKESVMFNNSEKIAKKKLILDLKTGLGKELKKNPGKVKIHKKTTLNKVFDFIKRIFTTF